MPQYWWVDFVGQGDLGPLALSRVDLSLRGALGQSALRSRHTTACARDFTHRPAIQNGLGMCFMNDVVYYYISISLSPPFRRVGVRGIR